MEKKKKWSIRRVSFQFAKYFPWYSTFHMTIALRLCFIDTVVSCVSFIFIHVFSIQLNLDSPTLAEALSDATFSPTPIITRLRSCNILNKLSICSFLPITFARFTFVIYQIRPVTIQLKSHNLPGFRRWLETY